MKRSTRIALELLGPPLLGALLLWLTVLPIDGSFGAGVDWWVMLSWMVLWAYLFAGIPSILYTLTMEVAFAKGLNAGRWPATAFSGLLGAGAGVSMVLVLMGWQFDAAVLLRFGELGLTVGLVLGLVIKFSSAQKKPGAEGPR